MWTAIIDQEVFSDVAESEGISRPRSLKLEAVSSKPLSLGKTTKVYVETEIEIL